MKKIKLLLILVLFSACWSNVSSKEIYVSKEGSDSNSGSEESPYLTIFKASQEAVAGDVVIIREGTFEETLTPKNSGTSGNPITYKAFPGERVIISALEALSGWELDEGAVYKTQVDWDLGQQNLVINGDKALDLARWPNNVDDDPYTMDSKRNTGGSGGSVINNAFLDFNEGIPDFDWANGGTIHFYGDKPGSGWICWRAFIKSSTSSSVTFDLNKNPSWIRTFHAPGDKGEFFLQGIREAIDYQNEWYFDPQTNTLFVQLPNDSAPEDGKVSMRKRILTANLNGKNFITLENLAFVGGGVEINGSGNKLIGSTVLYGNYTLGVVTFFNSGNQSVLIQGSNNTVEQCNISFGSGTGLFDKGSNTMVKNNYISNFCQLGNYDAPLNTREADGSKYINNTVTRGGRDGIQGGGQSLEFAYNDISFSNLMADDCALFYNTNGPKNTEIHHNWFHDAYSHGTKKKAAGIYLDNDSRGFDVHHNVVWNTEWSSIQMNWDIRDINIYNNTLWDGSQVMGFWRPGPGEVDSKPNGTTIDRTNVWNNLGSDSNWDPGTNRQNNLAASINPFEDSKDGDFRLKSGSAPINEGREIDGITDGFIGSAPDIGAYEFGGEEWVAGIEWELKRGPAGLGCYGLPGEDCIVISQEDIDGDGIPNDLDKCPDTPLGTKVDLEGCEIVIIGLEDEVTFKKDLILYPNPAENTLTISSRFKVNKVSVSNLAGREFKIFRDKNNIDISNLETGVYFLKVYHGDKTEHIRFLKK